MALNNALVATHSFHVDERVIQFTPPIYPLLGLLVVSAVVRCITFIKTLSLKIRIFLFIVEVLFAYRSFFFVCCHVIYHNLLPFQVELLASLLTLLSHYDFAIIVTLLVKTSIFIIVLVLSKFPVEKKIID